MGPKYLEGMIEVPASVSYNLRSRDDFKLFTPSFNCSTFGGRAFPVYAPRLWNQLPLQLRSQHSLAVFKQNLKTHLFTRFLGNRS